MATKDGVMSGKWTVAAIALVASAALAGPAWGSTAWEDGATLYYVDQAGERNDVALNIQGPDVTIQDSGGPTIGMVDPCRVWYVPPGTGTACPVAPITRTVVDLGDAVDSLSAGAMTAGGVSTAAFGGGGSDYLWSWAGSDDLTGGPGDDTMTSNGGRDLLDARDGGHDTVDCGEGDDIAVVDPVDDVTGCETLLAERPADWPAAVIPAAPAPTSFTRPGEWPALPPAYADPFPPTYEDPLPPTYADPFAPPADVRLKLSVSTVRLKTARAAGLPVRASCGEGCRVSVVVRVTRTDARRLRVPRTLARAARTGAKSGTARMRLPLRAAGLARARSLRLTIKAQAITAQGQRLFQDVTITLRR